MGKPTYLTREEFWEELPRVEAIAELGVFDGEHAEQIIRLASFDELHLVDLWEGVHWCNDTSNQNPRQRDLPKEFKRLKAKFSGPGYDGVQLHRYDAIEWLKCHPYWWFDVVYLDDDHTYEHVKEEIRLCKLVVRPGGWICGHDYNPTLYPGIWRAVQELRAELPGAEFRESGEVLASWFLRLPD